MPSPSTRSWPGPLPGDCWDAVGDQKSTWLPPVDFGTHSHPGDARQGCTLICRVDVALVQSKNREHPGRWVKMTSFSIDSMGWQGVGPWGGAHGGWWYHSWARLYTTKMFCWMCQVLIPSAVDPSALSLPGPVKNSNLCNRGSPECTE